MIISTRAILIHMKIIVNVFIFLYKLYIYIINEICSCSTKSSELTNRQEIRLAYQTKLKIKYILNGIKNI